MKVLGITEESLFRPEAVRWRNRMNLLEPLGDTIVILPCSMRKPYSSSSSHRSFMKYTKNFQELILTSPFGVCPRELEKTYPIQSYDVSTTGKWSYEEIEIVGEVLKDYVKDKTVIAHVTGGYREVCEKFLDECIYTAVDNKISSKESIFNLGKELRKQKKIKGKNKNLHRLRSIARYQFNSKKADILIPDKSESRGRFNQRIVYDGKTIATLLYEKGLYSLNIYGGKLLNEIDLNWVEIDFELNTNTLFCPGVVDADPNIIPNDEVVIIKKGEVLAVGKAVLSGDEMKKANKGVAVRIRHRVK
ncbi:MAG: DUF5591 domain-containing protein [Methanobacteriaceae archaeon]|nr:DUF5591 domain-containing protein [Methanobacteriaceae archaeon]